MKEMKRLKFVLALVLLVATVLVFVRYAATHPEVLERLKDTNPALMVLLLICYGVWFFALVWYLGISVRMYGKSMTRQENVLLSAYSSLLNFFGPGQSGPAFRGLYLKKRHGLPLKKYIFTTLLYYGFYAILSALLLCAGSRPWWQTVLAVAAAGGVSYVVIRRYARRAKVQQEPGVNLRNLTLLFAATVLQVGIQAIIFYIELRDVSGSVSVSQALTYTGAANFALFVSITPAAIGIREAFLVFSQNLHHIGSTVIVAANVIDRAMYLLLLGVLFILVLALHAKKTLHLKQVVREE